jgi:hypothetical protein
MNGGVLADNSMEEWIMGSSQAASNTTQADAAVCSQASPLTARIPGLLSLAAVPAAVLVNPFFFGLAGGLLAVICLLLSPAGCCRLGVGGLIGAVTGGILGLFVLH